VTSSHTSQHLRIVFDDRGVIANAGLLLPTRLAQRLGLRELLDRHIKLGPSVGHARVGEKALTLVASLLAGGDCIDDAAALRSLGSEAVLGHRAAAPSTLGTFLRSFTWGHLKQLDHVSELALARAWQVGAGPHRQGLTLDFDSTICETYGAKKQGAQFTYAKVWGYQPFLAITAESGEVVHSRLRGGRAAPARGAGHFVGEALARVRRAGFAEPVVIRADSGFFTEEVVRASLRYAASFSITARMYPRLNRCIGEIAPTAWQPIRNWVGGTAEVAEIAYTAFANTHHGQRARPLVVRLIVRRVLPDFAQLSLPGLGYRYHAFITNRTGTAVALEVDHRQHAIVENRIRDLKYGLGLNHLPSGRFAANAVWLALNVLAHNLLRWLDRLALAGSGWTAKTFRHRLLAVPGRLVRSGRQLWLRLPAQWPWRWQFEGVLTRLGHSPPPPA